MTNIYGKPKTFNLHLFIITILMTPMAFSLVISKRKITFNSFLAYFHENSRSSEVRQFIIRIREKMNKSSGCESLNPFKTFHSSFFNITEPFLRFFLHFSPVVHTRWTLCVKIIRHIIGNRSTIFFISINFNKMVHYYVFNYL